MKLQINKNAILEEARVVASFGKDGSMTKHHGMASPRAKVFSADRVAKNKEDIARVMNKKKPFEESMVKLGLGGIVLGTAGLAVGKSYIDNAKKEHPDSVLNAGDHMENNINQITGDSQ